MLYKEFCRRSVEYKKLLDAAHIMTEHSPNGCCYEVRNVIKDISEYISWETIVVCDEGGMKYQVLSEAEHMKIITSRNEPELRRVVQEIMSDPYWPDK